MEKVGKLFFFKNFLLNVVIAAAPLVVFALPGRLLDKKYDTAPWYFLGGICISFVVTMTLLGIRTMYVSRKFAQEVDAMKRKNTEEDIKEESL